jgi:hypothetical protein
MAGKEREQAVCGRDGVGSPPRRSTQGGELHDRQQQQQIKEKRIKTHKQTNTNKIKIIVKH